MKSFNLSEWALSHRSFVWFLMAVAIVAGAMSYRKLGREEDPAFAIKTMVVQAVWPGATIGDTLDQVTDRIEKELQQISAVDYTKSYTTPGQATVFAAVYLVLHGLVKLGIVAAIVSGSRKLYPWAIAALSAFVVWQGYEFALHPSAGLALLTLVDIAIVALTVREYRHHRSLRDAVRSVLGRRSSPPGPAASRRGRQHPEEGVR